MAIMPKSEGIMATSMRMLLKIFIGLFAALQATAASLGAQQTGAEASTRSDAPTMSALIARLRQDAVLRARFAENPRAVLREHGIDAAAFDVPVRMDDAQLQRLLAGWTRPAEQGNTSSAGRL